MSQNRRNREERERAGEMKGKADGKTQRKTQGRQDILERKDVRIAKI